MFKTVLKNLKKSFFLKCPLSLFISPIFRAFFNMLAFSLLDILNALLHRLSSAKQDGQAKGAGAKARRLTPPLKLLLCADLYRWPSRKGGNTTSSKPLINLGNAPTRVLLADTGDFLMPIA